MAIVTEEAIAKGIRRVVALTGSEAAKVKSRWSLSTSPVHVYKRKKFEREIEKSSWMIDYITLPFFLNSLSISRPSVCLSVCLSV